MTERPFTIGLLAKQSDTKVETIRYYEKAGLMPAPPRNQGGHRIYSVDDAKRLMFVRRTRALGFKLADVRLLLDLVDRDDYSCEEVQRLAARQLAETRSKLSDLKKLERVLDDLVAECPGGEVQECPIIDTLYDDGVDLPSPMSLRHN